MISANNIHTSDIGVNFCGETWVRPGRVTVQEWFDFWDQVKWLLDTNGTLDVECKHCQETTEVEIGG